MAQSTKNKKTSKGQSTTKKTLVTKTNLATSTKKQPLSMADLLSANAITPPKKGDEVEGTVVSISKKQLLFDIGWKSYAVLGQLESQSLATYLPFLNEGDTVRVRVVVEESREGYPVVSMRNFFEKGKWDILEEAQKSENEIEVVCGEYGKGGVFIDFAGIRGVIPKIQLSKDYIGSPEMLVGQKIKVKVLEVDQDKNRLVVSQKAAELGISYKELTREFEKIEVGKTYKARVVGFTEFGVFCEVGNIEGLIHISEISWEKVTDPRTYLKEGDLLDVMVVEKNVENLKLNLSVKRLAKDPWMKIAERYPTDKEVQGEVTRKEKYGYIVRLEPGVEGLVHVSKLPNEHDLKVGEKMSVFVEKVDPQNRRMSLVLLPTEKPVVYR